MRRALLTIAALWAVALALLVAVGSCEATRAAVEPWIG